MKKLLFLGLISLLYSVQCFSAIRIPDSVYIYEAPEGMLAVTMVDLKSDTRGKIILKDNDSGLVMNMYFRYTENNIINLKAGRVFRLNNIVSKWSEGDFPGYYDFTADLVSGDNKIDSYRPHIYFMLGEDYTVKIKTFGDLRKIQGNRIEYFYFPGQEPTDPGTIDL